MVDHLSPKDPRRKLPAAKGKRFPAVDSYKKLARETILELLMGEGRAANRVYSYDEFPLPEEEPITGAIKPIILPFCDLRVVVPNPVPIRAQQKFWFDGPERVRRLHSNVDANDEDSVDAGKDVSGTEVADNDVLDALSQVLANAANAADLLARYAKGEVEPGQLLGLAQPLFRSALFRSAFEQVNKPGSVGDGSGEEESVVYVFSGDFFDLSGFFQHGRLSPWLKNEFVDGQQEFPYGSLESDFKGMAYMNHPEPRTAHGMARSGESWRLGDFDITAVLGVGGYGLVTEIVPKGFEDFTAACKFEIFTEKEIYPAFVRPFYLQAKVDHKNVAKVYGYFSFDVKLVKDTVPTIGVAVIMQKGLCSVHDLAYERRDTYVGKAEIKWIGRVIKDTLAGLGELHAQKAIHATSSRKTFFELLGMRSFSLLPTLDLPERCRRSRPWARAQGTFVPPNYCSPRDTPVKWMSSV